MPEASSDTAAMLVPTNLRCAVAKTEEQQADGLALKVRETLLGQRTRLINTLRGHAAEFGVIAARGHQPGCAPARSRGGRGEPSPCGQREARVARRGDRAPGWPAEGTGSEAA